MQLIKNQTPDTALRNVVMLAKTALAFDMPIVVTSTQEHKIQGPIVGALQRAIPAAYEARVKRAGIVDAWNDPYFKNAVQTTGRRQRIMGAVTTNICLVFPAISAVDDGCEVQAVLGASGSPFRDRRGHFASPDGACGRVAYLGKHHGRGTRSVLEYASRHENHATAASLCDDAAC